MSNFHKRVETSNELVAESLTYLTSPLRIPAIGSLGCAVNLHGLFFNDVGDVVRREVCKRAICRIFSYGPELHGPFGVLIEYLGVEWQNLDDVVKLKERAERYSEIYADEKVPEIYDKFVRKIGDERTDGRREKLKEEFKRAVDLTLGLRYKERRKEVEESLLKGLDEKLREVVEEKLSRRKNNDLSSIFERKTGMPNPFKVIRFGDSI